MAKVRSPNYPSVDLSSALAMARKAFDKDNRNKMSRAALAKHLGHDTLSGPALTKLGAIRAYGLIEGAGDEVRITDDAVTALMAPDASPERRGALARLAVHPVIFKDLRKEYPASLPSDDNLRYYLIKRGFPSDTAAKAGKSFLATMRLVEGLGGGYDSAPETTEEEPDMSDETEAAPVEARRPLVRTTFPVEAEGTRREVITLDEGDVIITFPENLSADSFGDLKDHLDLFVKKMQRRAGTDKVN